MCQCPQRASIHFYHTHVIWDEFGTGCQCPQRASIHFYSPIRQLGNLKMSSCQCPQRASIHFYVVVQHHFPSPDVVCQCPQRASIHFYGQKLAGYQYHLICVNALNGLLSISTEVVAVVDDYVLSVSMPSTGFYPFLPILKQENGKTFIVSMPSTGFYPFLQ